MKKKKTNLTPLFAVALLFSGALFINTNFFNFNGVRISIPTLSIPKISIPATYNLYGSFMSWVSSGVTLRAMPYDLIQQLDHYYANNLNLVRYGYASRLGNLAITDCTKMYFGSKTVTDAITNNTLSGSQMHWLLHELAHTEQCHALGGREAYANRWFKEVSNTLKTTSFSSSIVKNIHDKMPMEKEAEAKAVATQQKLNS